MRVEQVRVGDVLALRRREVAVDPMSEYQLIGIYSFGKGIFHREPKLGAELGNYRFFAIERGDLVLSNIQAWEGAIGLATQSEAGKVGTHRFLSYVPIVDRIDTNWARWFFLSEPGMTLIRQAAPGTTIRNRTLAIDRFEALEIPLPPIDEQRVVADRLDRLQEAIVGGLGPRARVSEAGLTALGRVGLYQAVSELRERSSDFAPLGNLGTWSSGGTPSAKEPIYYGGDIPWAVIGDLNEGFVVETERTLTSLGVEHSSAKVVPPGTVMVAMYGSIGKLGVAGVEMATNQAIATCRPVTSVSADYLISLLRCIRPELVKLGQGGAQQNISQTLLKSVIVPKPQPIEQAQFVARVNQHLERLDRIRRLTRRREELTQSVVPAALNQAFAGLS